MVEKSDINMGTLRRLEAFHLVSTKFKIADLNDYQKLTVWKSVIEKNDIPVLFAHRIWEIFNLSV